MSVDGISPNLAKHIVQRMGETGQPPERGALAANVGTQPFLDVLREEYLLPMRESGRNSSFKLVQAPFGGGKTHFLHCLREVAWQDGFATGLVGISPESCPFDDTVAIYREVARNLELPPEGPEEEPQPGIDAVIRFAVEEKVGEQGAEAVGNWLRDEFAHARIESTAVRRAAEKLMRAILDHDGDTEELMAAFLRGEEVTVIERSAHQIREGLESRNAFSFLKSIAQLLRVLDVPGVVLLFDEMDRVMSLTMRRKKAIGDNLRQMMDHCGQASLPAVLWIYAVPPEFMETVVPIYPALQQRLKGASAFSTSSPLAPIIDLDRIPMGPVELLDKIARRLLELYERGYGFAFDHAVQDDNIARLAHEVGEGQLEIGARRTFVKAAVEMLVEQHRVGQRPLTDAEIRGLANRSSAPGPAPMEGEEDFF